MVLKDCSLCRFIKNRYNENKYFFVVLSKILVWPKFSHVCLQKSVVFVKNSCKECICVQIVQFRRKCQQGQNFQMYVSKSPQFLQFCQKSLQEIYVCVYFVLFRQKSILTYRVPKSVVQAKVLASPKFLNVCLPKAVVSVVLSKILARNIYVSIFLQFRRKCQQTHANTCKHLQLPINTCKHL